MTKSDNNNSLDNFPFQELNSKEFITKQNDMHKVQNFIKNAENAQAFNQNLISDSEIKNESDIF